MNEAFEKQGVAGRWAITLILHLILLLAIGLMSLCVGDRFVPLQAVFADVVSMFSGENQASHTYDIVVLLRLPRFILACGVGGALALAGAILQGMFRNPLVEPYTLGISGGAALGVSLAIVLNLNVFLGMAAYPVLGFIGSGAAVCFVYFLGARKATGTLYSILLTGVMVSFIASSVVMLVMAVSTVRDVHSVIFWFMGSLDSPDWNLILLAVFISLAGLAVSYPYSRDLNALILGGEEAAHLGVNVERTRLVLFFVASILTGVCVSVAGVIGFVGLVVPHVLRLFTGPDHRLLLPASFLAGATFLAVCDKIAQFAIEAIPLPVGVVTGIIGGTLFIVMLQRKRVSL